MFSFPPAAIMVNASLPAPMINTKMVKAARKAFISRQKTRKIA